MKTLIIALLLVFVPVGVYLAPTMIAPTTRRRALLRCVLPVLVLCIAAVSVYGVVRWCQQRGCVWEQHVVGEYRFKFTSERDSDWGYNEGNDDVRDDIFVSVYHCDKLISGPTWIGAVMDPNPKTMHFSAHRLPNESLIIFTRTDRETDVVFAFDTPTGECFPWQPTGYDDWKKEQEAWRNRREGWATRIRACLGDARYAFADCLPFRQ
jgi:hypothetical protein